MVTVALPSSTTEIPLLRMWFSPTRTRCRHFLSSAYGSEGRAWVVGERPVRGACTGGQAAWALTMT